MTSAVSPAASARSAARCAKTVGVSEPPGSLTRSRAKHTASAVARPLAAPAWTDRTRSPTEIVAADSPGVVDDLYVSNR